MCDSALEFDFKKITSLFFVSLLHETQEILRLTAQTCKNEMKNNVQYKISKKKKKQLPSV